VWDKGEAVGGGGDTATCWKRTFELIHVRGNGPLRMKRDGAVLRFPVGTGADFENHPCEKPVPLLRYLIRQLSDPGDVILDPTMGSGSTGVAAMREGRRFIGIELDPAHYATALKRLTAATGGGEGQLFG
jgi:DNA modification methylase